MPNQPMMYSRFIINLASIFHTQKKKQKTKASNSKSFGIKQLAFSMSHVAFHIMKTSMRLRGNGSKSEYKYTDNTRIKFKKKKKKKRCSDESKE